MSDGCLLLVERAAPPAEGRWAPPGGRVRVGETLRDAVAREVREETSLEVDVGDVVWAGDSIGPGDPPEWHFTIIDFRATIVSGEPVAGDDARRVEWVPLDDLDARPIVDGLRDLVRLL